MTKLLNIIIFFISSFKLTSLNLRYNRELCINSRKSTASKETSLLIPAAHHYTKRIAQLRHSLRSHEVRNNSVTRLLSYQ